MAEGAKKILPATDEIAEILGLNAEEPKAQAEKTAEQLLPMSDVDSEAQVIFPEEIGVHEEKAAVIPEGLTTKKAYFTPDQIKSYTKLAVFKYGPYVLIFAIAVGAYTLYLSKFSFSSIFKSSSKVEQTNKANKLAELQKQQSSDYNNWIKQFYYEVSDASVLEPDKVGPNGLTNFQNYLLGLNPKASSSGINGKTDVENLASGINPGTGKPLTSEELDFINNYFDIEGLNNKVVVDKLEASKASGSVDQNNIVNPGSNLPSHSQNQIKGVSSGIRGPLPVNLPYIEPFPIFVPAPSVKPEAAAKPAVVTAVQNNSSSNSAPVNSPAPSNNAVQTKQVISGFSDEGIKFNTNIPGRLEIPSLKINVPIIWSKTTKDVDSDLSKGVVHYPGTALPGDLGTSYISGHSSNYTWRKGNYNRVFAKFGELPKYASFKVTVVGLDGKDIKLHYVVLAVKEFAADDQAQFENTGESIVALSTCWPLNTTERRLVAFGKLTQVER